MKIILQLPLVMNGFIITYGFIITSKDNFSSIIIPLDTTDRDLTHTDLNPGPKICSQALPTEPHNDKLRERFNKAFIERMLCQN